LLQNEHKQQEGPSQSTVWWHFTLLTTWKLTIPLILNLPGFPLYFLITVDAPVCTTFYLWFVTWPYIKWQPHSW